MFLTPTDLRKMMERHTMFLSPDLQTKGILLLSRKEMGAMSNRKELKKKTNKKFQKKPVL